jgi:hypothetical protein
VPSGDIEVIITTESDSAEKEKFFAGIRNDPFFFDLEGMKNDIKFTGTDTFLTRIYLVSS